VYLGLLVHWRVLPVAWRIMPAQEKWDQAQWQLVGELMDEVSLYLEPTDCTLIADRGLARLWLLDILRRARTAAALVRCLPFQKTPTGWRFALRF
jgi:hypothetical protein